MGGGGDGGARGAGGYPGISKGAGGAGEYPGVSRGRGGAGDTGGGGGALLGRRKVEVCLLCASVVSCSRLFQKPLVSFIPGFEISECLKNQNHLLIRLRHFFAVRWCTIAKSLVIGLGSKYIQNNGILLPKLF